jgi:NitT/TauT family transport system permease protein
MAWKAGVAAEIIGTPDGSIGKMLYLSKIYLDTDDLLAWTVIIVIISVSSEKLFMWVLKKVLGYGYQN